MTKNNIYTMKINTPISKLGIKYDDNFIYEIRWENDIIFAEEYKQNHLSDAIKKQFDEYFVGNRKKFKLPYKLNITGFFVDCLTELMRVQYGTTTTYKDIANKLGNPNAARAVGNAMNINPIPLIIPCHRVIGSNGKLVGFRSGLDNKQWLLNFEKNNR